MSMKDLLNKMSQLEALPAPKTRQVLNESSPAPLATTTRRSLKDVFHELSESIPAGAKPLPVMDPKNKQAGAGFLTSTNPAVAEIIKTLDPKDVQIVQAPGQTQPGQSQPTAAGQPNPNQMQTSNQPNQTMQEDDDILEYGDPTSFEAGYAADAEQNAETEVYHDFKDGGAEAFVAEKFPEFNEPSDQEEEESLSTSEIQGELNAYLGAQVAQLLDRAYYDLDDEMTKDLLPAVIKIAERNGWTFDSPIKEGAKVDRMVKHIEKSEKKSGKSKDEAENIAWATANKRGMLDNKNKKKVKEGDIAPTSGIDTRGAGLGAGRSATTLEGKKPDFLDLDKDGNKKEPMKKAAADKKKKAVKENMNNRIQAARLEGKAHGLKGHAHNGKHYEDMEEGRAYHEGYKEGLDECYGMGPIVGLKREARMPATTRGMAQNSLDTPLDEMIDMDEMFSYKPDNSRSQDVLGRRRPGEIARSPNDYIAMKKGEPGYYPDQYPLGKPKGVLPEDDMEEGNAFTGALARTPKGGKFSVGGKSFTDRSSYDSKLGEGDFAFEAWDRQLNSLVKAGGLNEVFGMSNKEKLAKFAEKVKQSLQGSNVVFDGLKLQSRFSDEHMRKGFTITGEVKWDGGPMVSMTATAPGESSQFAQFNEKNLSGLLAWISKASKLQEGFSLREGFSVSISKGESNSPDSVNVNATDAEADMLLSLVKQAGMGIFGGDDGSDYGSPEVGGRSEINAPGGIEVVDDHDGMLGLMKKLSGIEGPNADYEEEDCGCEECGNSPCGCDNEKMSEARCDECGMMESKCGGHDEVLDEVESEDQMEFKVAEANAPDSGAANATNDTQGNAAANQALAKADAGQDIEDGMQDQSVQEELEPWMDKDAAEDGKVPAFMRKDRWEKNMADEIGPPALRRVKDKPENDVKESFTDLYKKLAMLSEESTAEKDEKAEKAGKKVTKDIEYDDKKENTKHKRPPSSYAKGSKEETEAQEKDKMVAKALFGKKKVDEWANQVGPGPGKGTDASLMQSIDFMMNDISGGLNKRKSTGQTTIPVVASQLNRLASRNTTSINENIGSHIKSLGAGRMADDDRDHPEIDNHRLYDDLTSKVSQMEDENGGARYLTLSGEANDIALRIASDTGFSAFSIIRYCSSHRAFNRWFYREKPAAFWESVSEMKRLAGLNEDDDGDGIPGVDAVSIAAKAAAAKGIDAPSAEEIAQKASEIKQLFDFLDAKGQIAPEFSKTGNSKTGNPEALDESLRYEIDKAKRKFIEIATWFGVFLLIAPLADAVLGISLPGGLFHPWNMITGEPLPGEVGYRGSAFPLRGPKYDDLNEIRRLSGLSEDDDGDGIPGVDLVSIAAKAAAAKGIDAPSAEEIKANLDDFRKSYAILKANGQEPVDESLDKLTRDAEKMFWNAAKFLGVYQLVVSPVASYLGIPHPDLAYIAYDAMAMLTPPSLPNFYDY